jgi:hypothetical protein
MKTRGALASRSSATGYGSAASEERRTSAAPDGKGNAVGKVLDPAVRLGGALVHVAIGLAFGLLGAWTFAGAVGRIPVRDQAHDPAVYAGVIAVLGLAGLTAALLPARRAASVDPLIALRME